jgi:hypothetical protein
MSGKLPCALWVELAIALLAGGSVGEFTLRLIMLALLCPATHTFCQAMNPPIYSEVIPTSSGLPYHPATDTRESFQAPNGKTVEVLVKGPTGSGVYARAIGLGETPDAYFPAVVSEATQCVWQ